MYKLSLIVEGKDVTILADNKVARGIYIATETKEAKNNIRILQITFPYAPDNVIQHNSKKVGSWSFLTVRVADQYTQYIFAESASQQDFDEFVQDFTEVPELQQQLTLAFQLKVRLTLGDL